MAPLARLYLAVQDGENLMKVWEAGKGDLAENFLAGIVAHLPALQAFTVPSVLGYERLKPGGRSPTACKSISGLAGGQHRFVIHQRQAFGAKDLSTSQKTIREWYFPAMLGASRGMTAHDKGEWAQ